MVSVPGVTTTMVRKSALVPGTFLLLPPFEPITASPLFFPDLDYVSGKRSGRRLMSKNEYYEQVAALDLNFALDNPLYADKEIHVGYACCCCLGFHRMNAH